MPKRKITFTEEQRNLLRKNPNIKDVTESTIKFTDDFKEKALKLNSEVVSPIQNHWMLIGTDNKKVEYQSKKNRIKFGEKGIGRFVLDRLGEICEMYTKNEESNKTIYWKTNWKNFEESGKFINEVAADLDYSDNDIRLYIPTCIIKGMHGRFCI